MAIGDAASAAGFPLVAGTNDRRKGWEEINRTRDFVAIARTWAAATFAAITHNHDASYYTKGEVDAGNVAQNTLIGTKVPAYLDSATAQYADGPSSSAYSRATTGSGYYAVWMNSARQFMRNTSSRRYKDQEKPFALDPRSILAMVPTTYHRKGQPKGTRELGLIAEDLAALDLPHIVQWEADEAGKERPEAVRYEQVLPVMLLHVCRAQQAQIDVLTARLDALTKETP